MYMIDIGLIGMESKKKNMGMGERKKIIEKMGMGMGKRVDDGAKGRNFVGLIT